MDNCRFTIVEDGNIKLSWFNGKDVFTVGTCGHSSFVTQHAGAPTQAELSVKNSELRLLARGPRGVDTLVVRNNLSEIVAKSRQFKIHDGDVLHLSEKLSIRIRFNDDAVKPTTKPIAPSTSTVTSTSTASPSTQPATAPVKPSFSAPTPTSSSKSTGAPFTASSSKTSGRPSAIRPHTLFSTPKPQRQGYPLRFLDPNTPQVRPFPARVEPADILNGPLFVPSRGGNHVAILFHNPITTDKPRERREIDDITFIMAAWGFRVEVIEEATYDLCQKAMNIRLKKMKDEGEIIDSLCMFAASHGIDNSSERLSILMHDGSFLDSVQLAAWAFDFKAKFTFIVLLTCHAEAAAHGIVWPSTTRGGIIWASNRRKTADFKSFSVNYSDGSTKLEVHDVFVRSIFEVLFSLVDVTELNYNITFDSFCALCESAISTADPSSSFGHQSNWNGDQVPLRFLSYIKRMELLLFGCTRKQIQIVDGEIQWISYRVPGRLLGGGSTFLTTALQKQVDDRKQWEDIPEAPVVIIIDDPTSPSRAESTTLNLASREENAELTKVNASPSLHSKSLADESDTLSEDEALEAPQPKVESRKLLEEQKVRNFNRSSGWKCRGLCRTCKLRMISPDGRTTDNARVIFQNLDLQHYTLCCSKNAKFCSNCT